MTFCRLFADFLQTIFDVLQTFCRLFRLVIHFHAYFLQTLFSSNYFCADFEHTNSVLGRIFADLMHTNSVFLCRLLADLMHTNSVFLCRILADLMHTNSGLCRLFADSMHTLRRTNQCQSKCRSTCGGGPSALSSRQRWRCYALRGEAAEAEFFPGEAAAAAAPRAGEGVDAGSWRGGLAGERLAAAAALRGGEGGARGRGRSAGLNPGRRLRRACATVIVRTTAAASAGVRSTPSRTLCQARAVYNMHGHNLNATASFHRSYPA